MSDVSNITEADILAEHIVVAGKPGMPVELARSIVDLAFDDSAVERMNELAEKNRQDALTTSEKDELEKYQRVGRFLNLIQAKARVAQ